MMLISPVSRKKTPPCLTCNVKAEEAASDLTTATPGIVLNSVNRVGFFFNLLEVFLVACLFRVHHQSSGEKSLFREKLYCLFVISLDRQNLQGRKEYWTVMCRKRKGVVTDTKVNAKSVRKFIRLLNTFSYPLTPSSKYNGVAVPQL